MRHRVAFFLLLIILALTFSIAPAFAGISSDHALADDGLSYVSVVQEGQITMYKMGEFLTNPLVSTLLLLVGIAGIAIEIIFAGGIGIAGILGSLCLFLFFAGALIVGNGGWLSVIFFLAGIVLVVIEIFVIPGFGGFGLVGAFCIFGSIVAVSASWQQAVISLLVAIGGTILLVVISVKNKHTRKIWDRLILFGKQENKEGYISSEPSLSDYVGLVGEAITTLRPAGIADIEGKRVDVVTEGAFVVSGAKIKVIAVEGGRVVVREML